MSSSWTFGQKVVLAVIPKISSTFSLLGSTWIMIEVITDKTQPRPKRNHPYHRLLFAMSTYDVLESIWNFVSTWAIPRGTPGVVFAKGTTATCSAQGFFLTLSVAVPLYNAMLSIYYVLVINYRFSDETLRKWIEPSMHTIAGIWAFGTALYSAFTGLLNNANLWCWIAPLPSNCLDSWRYGDEGNCIRGDNWWIYRWGFYFVPLWFCIFIASKFVCCCFGTCFLHPAVSRKDRPAFRTFIIFCFHTTAICTIMVYRYVRNMDKRTLKYRQPQRMSFLNTVVFDNSKIEETASTEAATGSNYQDDNDRTGEVSVSFNLPNIDEEDGNNSDEEKSNDTTSNNHGKEENIMKRKSQLIKQSKNSSVSSTRDMEEESDDPVGDKEHNANGDKVGDDSGDESPSAFFRRPAALLESTGKSVRDKLHRWQSSRDQYREDYRRTVEVFHQACFYLGAFYITHVWSTTNRIIQMINNGNTYYGLIVVHSL
jgi:hypothetical protein